MDVEWFLIERMLLEVKLILCGLCKMSGKSKDSGKFQTIEFGKTIA